MNRTNLTLGIAFVVAHAADAFLTLWATNNGFQEVNPLMAPFAHTWAFPFIKLIPALVALLVVSRMAARWPKTRPIISGGLALSVVFLGVVLIANVGEIL